MGRITLILLGVLGLLILAGCSPGRREPSPTPIPTPSPTSAPVALLARPTVEVPLAPPLSVEPIPRTTDELTQTLVIRTEPLVDVYVSVNGQEEQVGYRIVEDQISPTIALTPEADHSLSVRVVRHEPRAEVRTQVDRTGRPLLVRQTRRATVAAPTPDEAASASEPALELGAALWRASTCQECHGAQGEGGIAASLDGSALTREDFLTAVRSGQEPDHAFSERVISDEEIALLYDWLRGPVVAAASTPTPRTAVWDRLGLQTPGNVDVEQLFTALQWPTAMAFDQEGYIYIADATAAEGAPEQRLGHVLRAPRDGSAELALFADELDQPYGLAWRDGWLYVSERGRILRLRDSTDDGMADVREVIVDRLPSFGLHQNMGIAFGPDGRLYIGQGSRTNTGPETDTRNAAILVVEPEGGSPQVFASGVRLPADLSFAPNGDLFVPDQGADPPEVPDAPDEINHVVPGAHYGFPYVHGEPPAGSPMRGPLVVLPSGAGAAGLQHYSQDLFREWRGNLFVALSEPGVVQRIELRIRPQGGYEAEVHEWVSGFERPFAVRQGPEGALYVIDQGDGVVYRFYRTS